MSTLSSSIGYVMATFNSLPAFEQLQAVEESKSRQNRWMQLKNFNFFKDIGDRSFLHSSLALADHKKRHWRQLEELFTTDSFWYKYLFLTESFNKVRTTVRINIGQDNSYHNLAQKLEEVLPEADDLLEELFYVFDELIAVGHNSFLVEIVLDRLFLSSLNKAPQKTAVISDFYNLLVDNYNLLTIARGKLIASDFSYADYLFVPGSLSVDYQVYDHLSDIDSIFDFYQSDLKFLEIEETSLDSLEHFTLLRRVQLANQAYYSFDYDHLFLQLLQRLELVYYNAQLLLSEVEVQKDTSSLLVSYE